MLKDRIDSFFARLEWRWSLANMLWGAGAVASATVPAWAVRATNIFVEYRPLSWVAAGFIGFLIFCLGFFVYALARHRLVRARYNARLLSQGSYIDPLASVFERKRIFLNDFALPSNPHIHGKTFVDCEFVGPANLYLVAGNRIDEPRIPVCDAVVVAPNQVVFNCFNFVGCTFRRCTFHRVTFILSDSEYRVTPNARNFDWLNWISYLPDRELPLFVTHGSINGTSEASVSPLSEDEKGTK